VNAQITEEKEEKRRLVSIDWRAIKGMFPAL
jgi:hypothetical protein